MIVHFARSLFKSYYAMISCSLKTMSLIQFIFNTFLSWKTNSYLDICSQTILYDLVTCNMVMHNTRKFKVVFEISGNIPYKFYLKNLIIEYSVVATKFLHVIYIRIYICTTKPQILNQAKFCMNSFLIFDSCHFT